MATYLFVTNPIEYDPESIKRGDGSWWSCSKTTKAGDQLLVYLTGGIGIKYEWLASSDSERHPEWRFRCDVEHTRDFDPPIAIQELCAAFSRKEWKEPHNQFRGRKSIRIPSEIAVRIGKLRDRKRSKKQLAQSSVKEEQEQEFFEGERRAYRGTARNPQLRGAAKEHWGLKCYCCGFDFEEFYGPVAQGTAIVHHLELFSSAHNRRRKATVEDVRVVCANCHHMIHLAVPPMDVDTLKSRIGTAWGSWSLGGIRRQSQD
jgi:hypothetical protein